MLRRWTRALVTAGLVIMITVPAGASTPTPPAPTSPNNPAQTLPATGTGTVPTQPESPTPAPPEPMPLFTDLPRSHWAHASVERLLAAGVIAPNPQGLFRPGDPIRRSELAKMVLAARLLPVTGQCESTLRDVSCDAWYAAAVEHAYRLGIADGVGTDLFGPELHVNRQQLFTMIVRAIGKRWESAQQSWTTINGRLRTFADHTRIADWARPAISVAVAEKLVAGFPDSTFRPEALATRAEAAALISRILLSPEGLSTTQVDGRTITFRQAYNMMATMYATGEPGVGTITYTGMRVRLGAIAVDPTVIPLGSLLYVEGYGYGIAADIGGAIKGMKVDLFTHDYNQAAVRFGVQPRRVWLLP